MISKDTSVNASIEQKSYSTTIPDFLKSAKADPVVPTPSTTIATNSKNNSGELECKAPPSAPVIQEVYNQIEMDGTAPQFSMQGFNASVFFTTEKIANIIDAIIQRKNISETIGTEGFLLLPFVLESVKKGDLEAIGNLLMRNAGAIRDGVFLYVINKVLDFLEYIYDSLCKKVFKMSRKEVNESMKGVTESFYSTVRLYGILLCFYFFLLVQCWVVKLFSGDDTVQRKLFFLYRIGLSIYFLISFIIFLHSLYKSKEEIKSFLSNIGLVLRVCKTFCFFLFSFVMFMGTLFISWCLFWFKVFKTSYQVQMSKENIEDVYIRELVKYINKLLPEGCVLGDRIERRLSEIIGPIITMACKALWMLIWVIMLILCFEGFYTVWYEIF